MIPVKRVYEKSSMEEGVRVLVERLWPRGLTRERAAVHSWLKEAAPSPELRKSFGLDPAGWKKFQKRYWIGLEGKPLGGLHSAPLRLRVENQLGFKIVERICAIGLIADIRPVGPGEGGYNEDHEEFGELANI